MTILTRELTDIIARLDEAKQRRLLDFAQQLMTETTLPDDKLGYTARELWALPYEERNRVGGAASVRSLEDDIGLSEAHDNLDFDDDENI